MQLSRQFDQLFLSRWPVECGVRHAFSSSAAWSTHRHVQAARVPQESPHGGRTVAEIKSKPFHSRCLELICEIWDEREPTYNICSTRTYLLSRYRIGGLRMNILRRNRYGIDSNFSTVGLMLLIVELIQQPIVILILGDECLEERKREQLGSIAASERSIRRGR